MVGRIPQIDFSDLGGLVNEFDRSRANALKMRAHRDQMAQQRQAQQWAQNSDLSGMTRAQQLQSALQAGAVSPDRYFGHLPTQEMNEYQRAQVGLAEGKQQREQQLADEQSEAQIVWAMENLPNMTERKARNMQRAGAMPKLMERWLAKPKGAGTTIGKLREDLDAGLIDQQQYDAAVTKELFPKGGGVFETTPEGTKISRSTGAPVSTKVANDAVRVDTAYRSIDTELDKYEDLLKKQGITFKGSPQAQKYQTARRAIQLQLKELFNLGVLNGPDLQLMDELFLDPTSWKALGFTTIGQFQKAADENLEQIRGIIKNLRDQQAANLKGTPMTQDEEGNLVPIPEGAPQAAIDDGVSAAEWQAMTEEERALWQ